MIVYLVLLTYANSVDSPRSEYAEITLHSNLSNLKTSASLKVHIADDGSDPSHIHRLVEACREWSISPTVTNAERHGYGASFNLASQVTHSDGNYFLMVEDDWELTRPLDLDPLIGALDDGLGCIRLGYIGWTQPLEGRLIKANDMTFLLFKEDSGEPHVWSGHPRLETLAFQRAVGPWPVGLNPGETEFSVAHRASSRKGVAWPLDLAINASQQYCNLYAHIGAVQARTDQ